MNTIFIIEDDKFLGGVISSAVTESRMIAKLFVTAEDALEALKTEIPQVILLDISLPGMNGLEALKLMRDNEKTKNVPVIVVSNNDEIKDRKTAVDLGAKFIIKGAATPSDIIEHVRATIEHAKLTS